MPSPKLVPLVLSDAERESLTALIRKRTTSQSLALRARIVLACAEDGGVAPLSAVAARVGVSREMVRKWRGRFAAERLDGLADAPRPGAPRKITHEQVEAVIALALTENGPGRDAQWSTRSMAGETGLSQSSVSRIWRSFGLSPHTAETWQLSADPMFLARVRDVAGLYLNPPEHAMALAVDEAAPLQALVRTALGPPIALVTAARPARGSVRQGGTSLAAACELAAGPAVAASYQRDRDRDFLRFLNLVDSAVPQDIGLQLVLDTEAAQLTPEIDQWLLTHSRFRLQFTPTSASWINLAERWLAEFSDRESGTSAGRARLDAGIRSWASEWAANPRPFTWTWQVGEIQEALP
jgi:transposase